MKKIEKALLAEVFDLTRTIQTTFPEASAKLSSMPIFNFEAESDLNAVALRRQLEALKRQFATFESAQKQTEII